MKRAFCALFVGVFLLGAGMSQAGLTYGHPAYAGEEGEKKADAGPPPEFEYVDLDPLSLPIITEKGLSQQLSLSVSLEVDYGKTGELKSFKPILTDAYIQDLYGALGQGHVMEGNVVNVQELKRRLTAVTDKVLGPDHKVVRGVLLQVVQQRPI